MTGAWVNEPVVSRITLAFLEDTGYVKIITYSILCMGDPLVYV